MKANRVLVACCLALGGCSCRQNNSELRTVSLGHKSDTVVLWVSNHSTRSEETRPRIVEAKVSFDGVASEGKPKIEVFNSKHGWSEHAEFSADDTAITAQIVATVESNGQTYTVAQDWNRMRDTGVTGRCWVPEASSITRREDKGKDK